MPVLEVIHQASPQSVSTMIVGTIHAPQEYRNKLEQLVKHEESLSRVFSTYPEALMPGGLSCLKEQLITSVSRIHNFWNILFGNFVDY